MLQRVINFILDSASLDTVSIKLVNSLSILACITGLLLFPIGISMGTIAFKKHRF